MRRRPSDLVQKCKHFAAYAKRFRRMMTQPGSRSGLRVALLHNYGDSQQSMRLYAAHLGDALVHRGVKLLRIRPPGVVPEAWRARSTFWAKLDAYAGRFVVYPRLVRDLDVDV